MTKNLLHIVFLTTLFAFLTSCNIRVFKDEVYSPVFEQKQSEIYIKTRNIPETDPFAECELHTILSTFSYTCELQNLSEHKKYCQPYSYYNTPSNLYPIAETLTRISDQNRTFLVAKMYEPIDDYGYSNASRDYGLYFGTLHCYGRQFQQNNPNDIINTHLKEDITFSPDLKYMIPALSKSYSIENLTSTSARLTFFTYSTVSTGARLQRSLDNNTWTALATLNTKTALPRNTNSGGSGGWAYEAYDDTGLAPSTKYYYRAINFGLGGDSDSAPSVAVTTLTPSGGGGGTAPAAPSVFAVDGVTASTIDLSWTDNSNNETGFEIERSPNGTSGWANVTTTSSNTTSYTDTGLSASTLYYYRVRSTNGSGNSAYSAVVSDTTSAGGCLAPFDPTGLSLTLIGLNQINLTWFDSAFDETGYTVERSTTSSSGPFSVLTTLGADITTYSDTGLAGGTTFHYRIKATKTSCSDSGYTSVQSQATPGGSAPTAPSSLNGFPDVGAPPEITLTWQDNSSDETGFEIERSTIGGGVAFALIHTTSANDLSYNDNTALAATTYYYRIRAVNVSGNSAFTSEVSVVNP